MNSLEHACRTCLPLLGKRALKQEEAIKDDDTLTKKEEPGYKKAKSSVLAAETDGAAESAKGVSGPVAPSAMTCSSLN